MNSNQLQQLLKRMEKRQDKTQKEIERIQELIKEKLDWPKNQEPKGLTRLTMECILSYMDPSKRLCLSLFYPNVRTVEKAVPMFVKYLEIDGREIVINNTNLKFHKDKRICRLVSEKEANSQVFVSVAELDYQLKCSDVAFSKVCFDLFTGRKQFEVVRFINNYLFPFEMKMNVGATIVSPRTGYFARNYSNINGTIKNVFFARVDGPEDLRLQWVQNVDRLELVAGVDDHLVLRFDEIPNSPAKKICVDCGINIEFCASLIIRWCRNKTRAVGSELILTMFHVEEQRAFDRVFSSNEMVLYGFVRHEDHLLRLPMGNNLEVVLRINNEKHHFTHHYLKTREPRNYLHIKVQHSQP